MTTTVNELNKGKAKVLFEFIFCRVPLVRFTAKLDE